VHSRVPGLVYGTGAGHEYGTERSRLWDRTRLVVDEGLDGSVGHVNGMGLKGWGFLKGSGPAPTPCLKAIGKGFCKNAVTRMVKLRKDL